MDKILYKNELLGVRIREIKQGTTPVTDESAALQALTHKHKKGHIVKAHRHNPAARRTETLQECIVILKGRVRVDLYGSGTKVLKRVTCKAGEIFITISGGHAVHFLDDAEIIETKNGPFVADRVNL